MKKKGWRVRVIVICFTTFAVGAFGLRWQETAAGPDAGSSSGELLVSASPQTLARMLIFQGHVYRGNEMEYFTQFEGTVEYLAFQYGQVMNKGDVLLKFSAGELNAKIARLRGEYETSRRWVVDYYPRALMQLKAQLAETKRKADDAISESKAKVLAYEKAVKENIATIRELESTQLMTKDLEENYSQLINKGHLEIKALQQKKISNEMAAQAAKHLLKAKLEERQRLEIVAPFNGTVTGISESLLGTNRISPIKRNQYLFTITNLSQPIVQVSIDKHELHHFVKAEKFTCLLKRLQLEVTCRVQTAERNNEAQGYVVRLEMELGDVSVDLGDLVRVTRKIDQIAAAVAIPSLALRQTNEGYRVLVRRKGHDVFRVVTVGYRGEHAVEILHGLGVGEQVVVP